MNWGKGIIITFVLFAALLTTMAVISMRQEVGLVAPDYYKQEIAYQDQIDRINNYGKLIEKPDISLDDDRNNVLVRFPAAMRSANLKGVVHLYRSSTSKLDQKYDLLLDAYGEQRINIEGLISGIWKVKLKWNDGRQAYYTEVIINK